MRTIRATAIVVGVLFLVQTSSYLAGDVLVRAALDDLSDVNASQARLGALLQFVNVVAVIGIGVLMFPVLRKLREAMALGYTATKVMEAALLLVSCLFALLVFSDSPAGLRTSFFEGYDVAFQLAMISLGTGSLLFMYLLYAYRLVPRVLSALGALGYVALFASGWLEIAGVNVAEFLYIPGGLFELAFPLWLIIRGFDESAIPTSLDEQKPVPAPRAVMAS